ncbi:hypothetical protein CRUP_017189 [Coryphaenoides rupestris]|nr:hypothetical protein CRUP_017189 [Coryphaenoides rupestris]
MRQPLVSSISRVEIITWSESPGGQEPIEAFSLFLPNAKNQCEKPALTGTFTAPLAGIFSFSFTAYASVAAPGGRMYHQLQLRRDGEAVASAWEDNRQDSEDSSTHTLALSLERGAQVYVVLRNGRQLCGDTAGRNAFSGYLVYAAADPMGSETARPGRREETESSGL